MLTVSEALAAILNVVSLGPTVSVPLEESLGFSLAQSVVSDIDSPPFDKSLMDGYAVRAADLSGSEAELVVVEEVTAGRVPSRNLGPGEATRIMTGAPVPNGADLVIPVEETQFIANHAMASSSSEGLGRVSLQLDRPPTPGRFILKQGAAVTVGTTILPSGRVIRAQELAALAELGQAVVPVIRRPRVAILATGDELVSVASVPGPGQIRNSNEPMLAAQMQQAGADPVRLGVARDERAHLKSRIEAGLQCDFLLLSGGVSAGKLDLVPSELAAAGVRQVFHKIQMRPGKPLWFGVLERSGEEATPASCPCYVFGLPGNPVSSMVCCELFVRAALRKWMGNEPTVAPPIEARLTAEFRIEGNRPTYHPARLIWTGGLATVQVVDWIGSSDLCATVDANCVALFPAGDRTWHQGEILDVFPW